MNTNKNPKPIAFYLPQFHPIPENDKWWGKGFTEWTNVAKARANFKNHYQPHLPRDLGFYDLRRRETLEEQAELAKKFGIQGFCFYWYWFNGKQLLERPLYDFLENKKAKIDFCFCWANENWTRTWDGQDKEILMKQDYESKSLQEDFIDTLIPFFKDDRYIKIDGKPVLLVYRCNVIPNLFQTSRLWREKAKQHGFPDLHLISVFSFAISSYKKYGFDAGAEFPPHQFFGDLDLTKKGVEQLDKDFQGGIIDYRSVVLKSRYKTQERPKSMVVYRCAMPSWDNTARRQHTGHIFYNSSPELFHLWLSEIMKNARENNHDFIFINAWNEWAEGCHLEPDQKYQYQFLQAVKDTLDRVPPTRFAMESMETFSSENSTVRKLDEIRHYIKENRFLYRILAPVYRIYRKTASTLGIS